MASSGTYTFNLDVGEIIEEAYERAGISLETGYDYDTARRSLNLLLTEWSNRGVNLWQLDLATQTLTSGTYEFAKAGLGLFTVRAHSQAITVSFWPTYCIRSGLSFAISAVTSTLG